MTKQSISTRKHADVPRKSSLAAGGGQEATTPWCVQNPSWYFPGRTRTTNSVSPGFKRYSSFLVFEIFGGKLASESPPAGPSSASWLTLFLGPSRLHLQGRCPAPLPSGSSHRYPVPGTLPHASPAGPLGTFPLALGWVRCSCSELLAPLCPSFLVSVCSGCHNKYTSLGA